ncbi:hypothetical protein ACHAXT_003923 [Thalassiosira profunda]
MSINQVVFADEPLHYGDVEEGLPEDGDADEQCAEEPWDEGGKSHCGYSDGVHDTLMAIGSFIHHIFGEPSEEMRVHMRGIGSYFQEASYAARDLGRNRDNISLKEIGNVGSYMFMDEIEEEEPQDEEEEYGLEDIDENAAVEP